jgi:antitoxin (DNA-binding transcriptional repressor) of toxin-antitoxin stability system
MRQKLAFRNWWRDWWRARERGERILIARNGKPVAQLGPAPKAKRAALPPDDPLLNLDDFAIDGAGGTLTNTDIDTFLYGKP